MQPLKNKNEQNLYNSNAGAAWYRGICTNNSGYGFSAGISSLLGFWQQVWSPTTNESISRSFHLFPSVGYFVQDGLELGLGAGLNQSISKYKQDSGESRSRTQSISFRPYVRKYIALTDQLQLHGTGYVTADIGNSKFKDIRESSYEERSTSSGYGLGFSPGLTYFATPKLGFTATFGAFSYSRSKSTPKNNPHQTSPHISNSFAANLSPSSINIGIGYFIAR